ncbi:hypothetical protein BT67DRAFT_493346 [Trichocladium antarcticum]|uniref:Uncharacterized protein n=1 Tax=Trichocladium antarcticum TaxID=1450529 RepID=A0AAN6ZES9_9PEZI|nr:hypothetical protein BT67DRAFT_493346 [Trichocladium antarcticum]
MRLALTTWSTSPSTSIVLTGSVSATGPWRGFTLTCNYVFEAGAAYSGVAHACVLVPGGPVCHTDDGPNRTCAWGLQHTPQERGNPVSSSVQVRTGSPIPWSARNVRLRRPSSGPTF